MAHQADQQTMQLVLIRHGESEWNKLNLFTGWTDVELTDTGREEAAAGGRALKEAGFDFDVCYTSRLKRAIHTLDIVLGQMDREWLPVIKSWKLNERHYGALQGLNKADAAAEHGDEQVLIWRRSFDVCPPALEPGDSRDPTPRSNTVMSRPISCPIPSASRTRSPAPGLISKTRFAPRCSPASAYSSPHTATPCAHSS